MLVGSSKQLGSALYCLTSLLTRANLTPNLSATLAYVQLAFMVYSTMHFMIVWLIIDLQRLLSLDGEL